MGDMAEPCNVTGLAPLVMIVDDQESHAELLAAILDREGYRVVIALTPHDALRVVADTAPGVALMDVMMPGMDGYELCRRVKEASGPRGVSVVLVSGLDLLEDRARGFEAGADDFFIKPFNHREVAAKVRSLMRLKELQDGLECAEVIISALAGGVEHDAILSRGGHSIRVSELSARTAGFIGLSDAAVRDARKGGLLHDIGLSALKPASAAVHPPDGPSFIAGHPVLGERMCARVGTLRGVLPAIRSHHERWDGTGFPDGLKGEAIPLMARVVGVADSFDLMVLSGSPVREALEAILRGASSGRWDPRLAIGFAEMCLADAALLDTLYGPAP
jgi:putative two-component system response regulator